MEIKSNTFPTFNLLLLSTALFISIMTEALPAGFLLLISKDLGVTESQAGQLVTLYALGSLISAIPLTIVTQGWNRRKLLITIMLGFTITNFMTAYLASFILILVSRFLAGVFAGLLWAMVAGYAIRMVSDEKKGRAITVVMLGVPIALSIGIPLGTFIGKLIGWRLTFQLITIISLVLVFFIWLKLPNLPALKTEKKNPIFSVLAIPYVKSVLIINFVFAFGHNIFYTYISPYLQLSGNENNVDIILLIFGISSIISITIVGIFIDKYLRQLIISSLCLFAISGILFYVFDSAYSLILISIILWGLAFGGGATLFQTASAKITGNSADIAQSLLVSLWNLAIAGGGFFGGVLLNISNARVLPIVMFVLLTLALLIVLASGKNGVGYSKGDDSVSN
ncbi:MFS transporter [Gilliamella sp. Pra-s65]|uniref:MFS transporter n=1 Tax=unclassified Gilliamella TaxID=2685620 RepID=UPI001327FD56|nr:MULTISPECIES: MFS transporter [unclassified Gilliamella]MWN32776.1 MFS transporter [Gilliamella sp. Pra-s60]MWN89535.1 MFS transporter [Gilliamella sp. Pra-s65]MWP30190.1 MFS transporter [Gilliamella sp. Pra-s54]MWP72543.1 MFS transporter [Gilliamella sp. Pra-s52]